MQKLIYFNTKARSSRFLILAFCLFAGKLATAQTTIISGKVINELGEPVPGATITVKGTTEGTTSDGNGAFHITAAGQNPSLLISSIGYEEQEITTNGRKTIIVTLKQNTNKLDEAVVIAYGTTTRRLNTGSIGRITAKEISSQPVTNPMAALEGRIPGLTVTKSNGVPGSSFKIRIRGQNSIAQGSEPLFVIDGTPFAPNNASISQLFSAVSANGDGISPLNSINPSDIESIEILKDADATSIYGSRGANGVVLITTKKGKAGKFRLNMNVYSGVSTLTRTMDFLNTSQYLQMRHEAFSNDEVVPDKDNAYDILLWDTTRYTDFKKLLIGNRANTTDAHLSVSGGNVNTQFLIGVGYHHETTVFPGDFSYKRGSVHFNISHMSDDHKLGINLTGNYSLDKNNINSVDLAGILNIIPNLPPLYDSAGNLNWSHKGVTFINPLSFSRKTYVANTNNLVSNLRLSYAIFPGLTVNANMGYNTYLVNEIGINPKTSQNPASNPTGSSSFGISSVQSWIIEPQLRYHRKISNGSLELLLGATHQENKKLATYISATGYTNDALIKYISAAGNTSVSNNYNEYRYQALFGRVNYNWENKYILNLSARKDGSSRFGPGKRYAFFGAVGGAWIFSNEKFSKRALRFLSYGKLRGSYGTSGNDQIGDYKYLSSWTATKYAYQGSSGLYPTNLFNPDYSWEVNKKLEVAVELGIFRERILLSASYFRNRSGNQLISYKLPYTTGFLGLTENFPALVQNTGTEITLFTKNVEAENFGWATSINLTIPVNKLIEFPGIENSSYSRLAIGKSLSAYGGFRFLGVGPETGVYQFMDSHGNATSSPSPSDDYVDYLGDLDPKFYGGLLNTFRYKEFSLDIFLEFKAQKGLNYLYSISSSSIPGTIANQPVFILNHWRKLGDKAGFQMFTQQSNSAAAKAAKLFTTYDNDAKYSDASYARVKNISFSYELPQEVLDKLHIKNCRFYVEGQNLLTITNYMGSDPETQNALTLPPLKTFTAGLKLTL